MTDAHPTYIVQVVIDCADPHPVADWWAEAFGWQVEPQDEEPIRSMIDQGLASEDNLEARGLGQVPSIGSVGECYDNSMIESLWSCTQVELHDRKKWTTRVS
jgi:transposase InsO family protein